MQAHKLQEGGAARLWMQASWNKPFSNKSQHEVSLLDSTIQQQDARLPPKGTPKLYTLWDSIDEALRFTILIIPNMLKRLLHMKTK